MTSPYLARARSRMKFRHVRQLAPKHPPGPEARLRLEVSKLFRIFHGRIRIRLLHVAARKELSWRDNSQLRSVFADLLSYGQSLTDRSAFRSSLRAAAKSTSKSVRDQVAKALGIGEVVAKLTRQELNLIGGVVNAVESRLADSLDRAAEVFSDWNGEDLDALDNRLTDRLSGIEGGALASTALVFGAVWADMNQEAQTAEGVEAYLWIAQRDRYTRPAHANLDMTVDDWNDPPLKADASSNGEDCHPGNDFNCRCIAGPIPN